MGKYFVKVLHCVKLIIFISVLNIIMNTFYKYLLILLQMPYWTCWYECSCISHMQSQKYQDQLVGTKKTQIVTDFSSFSILLKTSYIWLDQLVKIHTAITFMPWKRDGNGRKCSWRILHVWKFLVNTHVKRVDSESVFSADTLLASENKCSVVFSFSSCPVLWSYPNVLFFCFIHKTAELIATNCTSESEIYWKVKWNPASCNILYILPLTLVRLHL